MPTTDVSDTATDRARMEANRRSWDARLDVHVRSAYYDVDAFLAGQDTLLSIESDELGDVAGHSQLHLQCHFGLDTLSLDRRGATVTGVDFSEPAIAKANELAAQSGLEARFIVSNVYDLTRVLHEQFDIVFTSYGVLTWLPDVAGWARVVGRFLRPGGTFVIAENHPMADCFEEVDGRLELTCPLFQREPELVPGNQTYADLESDLGPNPNYQWSWRVGDMVSSLIDAGLRIERLLELPIGTWRRFPSMTRDADGWWRLPDDPLPLLVACRAVKPL